MKIQDQADIVIVGHSFVAGYLDLTVGARGNDWGEVCLGPEAVDQLIAHLIEVRGAYRVQQLIEQAE